MKSLFSKRPAKDSKNSDQGLSPTFCVMPWINLATETNGKCKICCVVMTNKYIKNEKGEDFHIQKDEIGDIWNSEYLKDVRRKMLAGERVPDCFYCHSQEDLKLDSPRISYNKTWLTSKVREIALVSASSNGQVDSLPSSLEPRPGITCNLKCNMCWSMSSSKVYADRKKVVEENTDEAPDFLVKEWSYEVKEAARSDFNWSESETYLKNFRACAPHLKRLYFTGGEPTIIKSNLRLLRELIDAGRTDLLVSFTTNLQQLHPDLMDLVQHFSRVEITGSIDGLGPANEYIRFPSSWKNVSNNLLRLHELYPRVYLSVMSVVQISNVFSLVELMKWLAEVSPHRQIQVIPTALQGPSYLRADILPDRLKKEVYDDIEEALENPLIMEKNKSYLRDMRTQIMKPNPKAHELREKFRAYAGYLDRTRKTDFVKTFPRLKSLMEEPHA